LIPFFGNPAKHHRRKSRKKAKKAKIMARNKKHNLINIAEKLNREQIDKLEMVGGLQREMSKIRKKERDTKKDAAAARVQKVKTRLDKSRQKARDKWKVAAANDGSFMVR
jgi:hypothetical protein